MKILITAALSVVLFALPVAGQTFAGKRDVDDRAAFEARLNKKFNELIDVAAVPGMSVSVLRDGKIYWSGSFGVKNSETKEPVSRDTIFEAASLTKPVVAYAVLKLVDQGKLDLDVPLNKYLGSNYDVGDDKRLDLITARRVLSHTSGFPNWRNRGSNVLPINFTPGEKFSYSGEGFVYLSKVVEKITGVELAAFVKKTVFEPLGMTHSSIAWEKEFLQTKAFNHDWLGIPQGQNSDISVNAAASLQTTSGDYAKFVTAILKGTGLKAATRELMLTPQIEVDAEKAPELRWGLGWGLQINGAGKSFWHWGDNGWNKSFVIARDKKGDGVVFFTNSANGLSFLKEVLDESFGNDQATASWLDYERYDSPSRLLSKAILELGAKKALSDYGAERTKNPEGKLSERQMNRLGYDFLRIKKYPEAILLFEQNTLDFPESGNVWDSLAEAHMMNGDKEKAIEYYRKSLSLDPSNKNASGKIKELGN